MATKAPPASVAVTHNIQCGPMNARATLPTVASAPTVYCTTVPAVVNILQDVVMENSTAKTRMRSDRRDPANASRPAEHAQVTMF